MSNYPMGAEHDPSAPYNQSEDDGLCIYCHSKERSECRQCYLDDHADDWEDDI